MNRNQVNPGALPSRPMAHDRPADRIVAVVLSHQRSMPVADHMIGRYEALWPGHPFVFRLPAGPAADLVADRRPGLVETVAIPGGDGRGRIRATALGLLDGLDDDEWVYWCIDDKYPVRIDVGRMDRVVGALAGVVDPAVAALCPTRPGSRHVGRLDLPERHVVGGSSFARRVSWERIWLHQFARVGLIRSLMDPMPDELPAAQVMDDLIAVRRPPTGRSVWMVERSLLVVGESTRGGMMMGNCAASIARHGGLAHDYEVLDAARLIGESRLRRRWSRARDRLVPRRPVTEGRRP